ncbi:MAG: TetR/AcrR family transcriptional regulator [Deltaproteobacteria bacterium]|nr:TetR/AcrR family transcriptional regulator [Deltaproteobacteria bacterium]MBW1954895.1 TetR/AcrR family transcriptional regulator [Deltaproteobacteria bacterium]MBW2041279.1 TetR/AcrR family transcriptional regulator [Deltaproteobacteria bacterium]MBW2131247.1 TetR/AcrR family transcriptional regulator [Deltaproteobacteria bacterium]
MNERSFIIHTFEANRGCVITGSKRKNDKYHRILEAAIKVFADQGFYQSTVSQIAREAGVADGTIYLYFKNKDDILIQFFRDKTKQVFESFRKAVQGGAHAEGKLRQLIRLHLKAFQDDRNMAVVYQQETHQINRPAEEQIREMSKMYLDLLSEIIEQGQEEGSIRKDLYLGLVKRFMVGAVDEVINTWLHSRIEYDLAAMADPLVELMIHGVGVSRKNTERK